LRDGNKMTLRGGIIRCFRSLCYHRVLATGCDGENEVT
jgi:hypothetical protein